VANVNDTKFEKLGLLGYTGALADRSAKYKVDNGISDWLEWYRSQGITEAHINDAAMRFWTDLVTP